MMQRIMIAAAMAATSATFAGSNDCELQQTAKLVADDGASGDYFGYSVAFDAGVVVIGASYDDASGSAYVFELQADGTWSQTAKLTANDGAEGDHFGSSVALDDGVVVIGAHLDDDNSGNSGSVYIFEQQADGTWSQTSKITADDGAGGDEFGHSVALDAGVAVIGAWGGGGGNSGTAYVFEQQADGTWSQTAKLTADDGDSEDHFGTSTALDAGVAVIGAYLDDDNGSASGSAYVFEQQADGTWSQTTKLTADDGASDDRFGWSVALDGGVAVIGAYYDDDNGTISGSAYVFEQQGDGTWSQTTKLTANDGASSDWFGWSVALDADVVVIGASLDDDNGSESGSAYVFEQQADGTWLQTVKLTADDGVDNGRFGHSVALDAGVAMVGAYRNDNNGSNSGSVYVYGKLDCDANGLTDACEIEDEPSLDCDLDGVLDSCATANGSVDDCNENGIPDSCDIDNGGDADGDGYLDECECDADIAGPDGPGFSDGIVGTDDLLTVIGYWGSSIPGGDIDGDGIVGTNDLLAVIAAWGPCE